MAATTTLLGLLTPTQGTLSGTWGDSVNYGISDYLDIAIAGTLSFAGDGAITLANTTGSASGNGIGSTTAQYMVIRITGTQTVTKVITGPSYSKLYMVDHAGATSAVTFKAAGQTGVSIAVGEKAFVYYNGTDYIKVASSAGGITYGAVKTTTYTAVANEGVQTNTTGGAFTVNLPATPATGTQVFIVDSFGTWATNNLTIGRNGSTIEGSATDLVCDINGVSIQCIYNGTTWDIYAQVGANDTAVVTLNGTQTLTNKTLTTPTLTTPVASTTIGVGGATAAASGAGITFPADQTILGASSNANTLDDYEEGTWTPSLGGTATYTTQDGNYTKVGRLVNIRCNIVVNLIGTGSTFQISGLPFTTATTATGNPPASGVVGYFGSLAVSPVYISTIAVSGGTTINVSGLTTAGATASSGLAVFGNSARIDFTMTYYVN
jgi:hypothetical protein